MLSLEIPTSLMILLCWQFAFLLPGPLNAFIFAPSALQKRCMLHMAKQASVKVCGQRRDFINTGRAIRSPVQEVARLQQSHQAVFYSKPLAFKQLPCPVGWFSGRFTSSSGLCKERGGNGAANLSHARLFLRVRQDLRLFRGGYRSSSCLALSGSHRLWQGMSPARSRLQDRHSRDFA